jgi:hypothetical protein
VTPSVRAACKSLGLKPHRPARPTGCSPATAPLPAHAEPDLSDAADFSLGVAPTLTDTIRDTLCGDLGLSVEVSPTDRGWMLLGPPADVERAARVLTQAGLVRVGSEWRRA